MSSSSPQGWDLWWSLMKRALSKRCPQCNQGRLLAGYASLRESCDHCGLIYRREQGAMTGSMYVTAVVTEIFAMLLVVLMYFFTDWGKAVALPVGLSLTLIFCVLCMPFAMVFWVGVEYFTDLRNGEKWAKPRWNEPEPR